jgi:NAD(P)H dehydrogenase (quinone)
MIVICGATGKVGGSAARALRARGLPVTAVVRNESKARSLRELGCAVAIADLRDERATSSAFEGARAALVIVPLQPTAEDVAADAQHIIDVLGAALEHARARHVVAISDYGAHVPEGTGVALIFRALEQRLLTLNTELTLLRSAEHMQNWTRMLRAAGAHGTLASLHHPVARKFPTVSAFDVGLVAAELLASTPEPARGPRVIHVEGPRRYSAADVAGVFEAAFRRRVTASELARDQWSAALAAGGLHDSYAQLVCALQDAHNAGKIDVEPGGEVRRGSTELAHALEPVARAIA